MAIVTAALTGLTCSGDCRQELKAALGSKDFIEGKCLLIDARYCRGVPTSGDMRACAECLNSMEASTCPKIAVVAPNTYLYGMFRMFSIYAELQGLSVMVYRDLDEAEAWLSD